jgi:hypothetical protein
MRSINYKVSRPRSTTANSAVDKKRDLGPDRAHAYIEERPTRTGNHERLFQFEGVARLQYHEFYRLAHFSVRLQ